MSEVTNHLFDTIDRQHAHESASTRRTLVTTTAAALGSIGLLSYASPDAFAGVKTRAENSVENITTVAATAEVLATIVNTVGAERLADQMDAVTLRNVRAAAQQEKNHYELLTSSAVGGKPATTTIYVPDEVFASPESLLTTLASATSCSSRYLLAHLSAAGNSCVRSSSLLAESWPEASSRARPAVARPSRHDRGSEVHPAREFSGSAPASAAFSDPRGGASASAGSASASPASKPGDQ